MCTRTTGKIRSTLSLADQVVHVCCDSGEWVVVVLVGGESLRELNCKSGGIGTSHEMASNESARGGQKNVK